MYFLKMDDTFAGSDISMDMFTDVMPSSVKEVQQKIETALGMTITNLKGLTSKAESHLCEYGLLHVPASKPDRE